MQKSLLLFRSIHCNYILYSSTNFKLDKYFDNKNGQCVCIYKCMRQVTEENKNLSKELLPVVCKLVIFVPDILST